MSHNPRKTGKTPPRVKSVALASTLAGHAPNLMPREASAGPLPRNTRERARWALRRKAETDEMQCQDPHWSAMQTQGQRQRRQMSEPWRLFDRPEDHRRPTENCRGATSELGQMARITLLQKQ